MTTKLHEPPSTFHGTTLTQDLSHGERFLRAVFAGYDPTSVVILGGGAILADMADYDGLMILSDGVQDG